MEKKSHLNTIYMKRIVFILFIVLQFVCWQVSGQEKKTGSELKAGMKAPNFVYRDVNDREVSLKSLRGKYVYIDFWATWCGPCRGELPHLKKLEKNLKKKKIVFVSISSDVNREEWKEFVRKNQLGGIQLNIDGDWNFENAFGVKFIPRFVLLNKKGKIVDMDAPRPSSPGIYKYLSGLDGI